MAEKKPLVLENGEIVQIQSGDVIAPDFYISGEGSTYTAGDYIDISGSTITLKAIDTPTTIYIATTGNDTTGDGSSGNPWATLTKALSYLDDKILKAQITIQIANGTYYCTETILINHLNSGFIKIQGMGSVPSDVIFSFSSVDRSCFYIQNCKSENILSLNISNISIINPTNIATLIGLEIENSLVYISDIEILDMAQAVACTINSVLNLTDSSIGVDTNDTEMIGILSIDSRVFSENVNINGNETQSMFFGVYGLNSDIYIQDGSISYCAFGVYSVDFSKVMLTGNYTISNNYNNYNITLGAFDIYTLGFIDAV